MPGLSSCLSRFKCIEELVLFLVDTVRGNWQPFIAWSQPFAAFLSSPLHSNWVEKTAHPSFNLLWDVSKTPPTARVSPEQQALWSLFPVRLSHEDGENLEQSLCGKGLPVFLL